jgi:serine/threonine-protein kinase RsbW
MSTVTFPGDFESLAKISEFITQAAREAGFNNSDVYAVELAVDEACSNIIDHAYGGEGNGDIECSVEAIDQGLRIILRDFGRSFDPDSIKPPNLNAPLKKIKPRGVGLYLIQKMMDEVHYQTSADTGNQWIMIKRKS